MVQKLQLNKFGMTTDEVELERFLANKTFFSKTERKYLLKYVVKGLPESIRGRVSLKHPLIFN